jgi:ABC-type polysaccharide/polyol phosphate transport system ATPase subunit
VLALESDPRVLIQDNFATLFDNEMEFIARKELKRMNKDLGTTVILSSINDHALKKFCSVLVYLENGHITKVRSGHPKQQRGDYSKK